MPAESSLNRDHALTCDWCDHWGLLVNITKTMALAITRSKTLAPSFPNLLLDGTVVEEMKEWY